MSRGSGPSGRSGPAVRVKTARKRSLSSTLWLQRQLNDPTVWPHGVTSGGGTDKEGGG